MTSQTISKDDAAVNGLLTGLLAGVLMMMVLVAGGLIEGSQPGVVLSRFDPSGDFKPVSGAITHLAISAVYGVIFGLLWKLTRRYCRSRLHDGVIGLLYGLALFWVGHLIYLTGSSLHLAQFPLLHLVIAYLVYGAVMGIGMHEFSSTDKSVVP